MNEPRCRSAYRGCIGVLLLAAPLVGQAQCTVSSTGVNFGSYDSLSLQDTDIAGSVSVICDVQTSYTISSSAGSGTYAWRLMTSGADELGYNLFLDPERQTVWGDGSGGTQTLSGIGTNVNHTVYGRIPARQPVSAGVYGDSVTIILTF